MKFRIYVHDQDEKGNDADFYYGGDYSGPQELATALTALHQEDTPSMADIVAECDSCHFPHWTCTCKNCDCSHETYDKVFAETYEFLKPGVGESEEDYWANLRREERGEVSQYELNGGRY